MRVEIVSCLEDNYAYVLVDPQTARAVVVDPSEAEPVLRALDRLGATLAAVLNTHHHHDHVGGNEELAQKFPGVPVYGHASDQQKGRIPAQTRGVEHGEAITEAGFTFRALHIPGHTLGAVAWVTDGAAFTGDTLFLSGCGRLFEGTPAQMHRSLNETLGELPDDTRVYCGHEYTVKNLRFGLSLVPDDAKLAGALREAESARAEARPTVPGTLGRERALNPFLRCNDPAIRKAVGVDGDEVAVFAAVRERRNNF